MVVLAAGVVAFVRFGPPSDSRCGLRSSSGYTLGANQTRYASIIAGVGERLGLPDHAVTVALATALQESKLRNLTYGTQDSVGLFQQRPSQGWGTVSEILDPVYAATAFYQHLELVPSWQTMPVTEAAQMVQHSADPQAYAQWANEARLFAIAFTGEVPAGLSCSLHSYSGPAPSQAASALAAAEQRELGGPGFGTPVPAKQGWELATWAVAHAFTYHLRSVSFAGQTWTPSGSWRSSPAAATSAVEVHF